VFRLLQLIARWERDMAAARREQAMTATPPPPAPAPTRV